MDIVKIQHLWRYYKYYRHQFIICRNIKSLINHCDVISLNTIYDSRKITNIEFLYSIFRSNKMYVYELSSLKKMIETNMKEIHTNTNFTKSEIEEIKFLTSKIKERKKRLTKKEKFNLMKDKVFTVFHELDTYFSIEIYQKVQKDEFSKILNELKMMWNAFQTDNKLNDIELFGIELKWEDKNYENQLLTNIKIMIDNNLEKSFRKAISFVIIGAFAYVIPDIKKTYSDIDFI